MAQCVYCGKTDNLNTSLSITLEDKSKVTVDICDEHTEEASVKSAREAYQSKQVEIDKVLEAAKALGLNISETKGGITVAEQVPPPLDAPPSMTIQQTASVNPLDGGDDVISTAQLDQASSRGMQSVGGNVSGTSVESHPSYSTSGLKDQLSEDITQGKVKMTMAEGREGQPLAIPQKRVDGTGTTRISINKSQTDQQLQERFKKMSLDSKADNVPDFARSGYQNTQRDCPFCKGEMEINGEPCPKCKGAGVISIY